MAKGKKGKGVSIPKRRNGYQDRKKVEVDTYRTAEKDTQIQYMTDTLVLTLNDPAVMGKDVFGKERLQKIIEAWGKKYDEFHAVFEDNDETDYYQLMLDKCLRQIFGDQMDSFGERYPWIKDQTL